MVSQNLARDVLRKVAMACALVLLLTASKCGGATDDAAKSADDIGRLLSGHLDDAKTASQKLEDALSTLRQIRIEAAEAARGRVDDLVTSARIPEEIKEGFTALTWDATCAVVLEEIPEDAAALSAWLSEAAVRYGVEFLGAGASQYADQIVDVLGNDEAWSDAQTMCSEVGGVLEG
jgi:hypothetical protein